MSIVATAPVLVPLATAGLTALFSGRSRTQQAISFVGVLGFLGAAVTLLAQVSASGPVGVSFGDWPAPYGIQFRFDGLSTALLLLTALMGLVTLIFLGSDADPVRATGCCCRCCTARWPAWPVPSAPPTCSTSMSGSR